MTDEERKLEGPEEAIEDLEAPEAAQHDVEGGTLWKDIKQKASPQPVGPVPPVITIVPPDAPPD